MCQIMFPNCAKFLQATTISGDWAIVPLTKEHSPWCIKSLNPPRFLSQVTGTPSLYGATPLSGSPHSTQEERIPSPPSHGSLSSCLFFLNYQGISKVKTVNTSNSRPPFSYHNLCWNTLGNYFWSPGCLHGRYMSFGQISLNYNCQYKQYNTQVGIYPN